jgi:iron complex outermembrane receptor protein
LFLFLLPALAAEPDTEAADAELKELEKISVTGTRIKRTDVEGSLPVSVFDRQDLEQSGNAMMADFLRSLPFNSFGSTRASPGNTEQGESYIDLRGLGAERSLVLIDGRRTPKTPLHTLSQNIGIIPMAAIERVEILTDGASAIYGSDAIGGVVNLITRDDFHGVEFMLGMADSENGASERDHGYLLGGYSGERGNFLIGLSWERRDISYRADYPWTEPGGSTFSNNFTTVDPETGFDNFNTTAIPGGCQDSDAFYLEPDPWSLSGEICLYDFTRVMAAEVDLENRAVWLKGEYEINESWQAWLQGSVYQTDSFSVFAPVPLASWWFELPLAPDSPNNPTNPDSAMHDPAFGPNVLANWSHRFDSLGTRDSQQEGQMSDLRLGVSGWAGGTELEFGIRGTLNKTESAYYNQVDAVTAFTYIADGTYDLQHPRGNPDSVLEDIRIDLFDQFDYDQAEVWGTVGWDMWSTSAGPVSWLVGAEYRHEDYKAVDNSLWKDSWANDRGLTALFFETLVPATDHLEFTVAGRYDRYSDYGSDFSPKLAMRWRVLEPLVLRASWGEGFRAPDLMAISLPPWRGVAGVFDPVSCEALNREPDCFLVFPSEWRASSALDSEQSEQYSLGLVWQPSDWFNGTVDYYDIAVDQLISDLYEQDVVDRDLAGDPIPKDLGVVRDPDSGLITQLYPGTGNEGRLDTSGIDINAVVSFPLGPGRWRTSLLYSQVFDYSINGGRDRVGDPGNPESRARLSSVFDIWHLAFTWNVNYIDSQYRLVIDGVGEGRIPSWTTHDLQATWNTSWDGRLAVGAQNATDEIPDLDERGGYDYRLYDAFGRIIYIRYTQTF